jgi:hypothetical protein
LLPFEPAKCLSHGSKVLFIVSFKSCISLCHSFAYDVKQEEFEPRAWGSTFVKLKTNFLFLSKASNVHPPCIGFSL